MKVARARTKSSLYTFCLICLDKLLTFWIFETVRYCLQLSSNEESCSVIEGEYIWHNHLNFGVRKMKRYHENGARIKLNLVNGIQNGGILKCGTQFVM